MYFITAVNCTLYCCLISAIFALLRFCFYFDHSTKPGNFMTISQTALKYLCFCRHQQTSYWKTIPALLYYHCANGKRCYATDPVTLHAALSVLLFVTLDTNHLLITRYETLVADRLQANLAAEALLVPLFSLVLVLLHSCTAHHSRSITYLLFECIYFRHKPIEHNN